LRVELHFHLLPGVDDGPTSVQESVELATLALADGTGTVVCTPHVRDVDVLSVPARVEELRARLREAGVPLELQVGAEVAQDDVAWMSDAAFEIAAHGPPGRRWILLEAPLSLDPDGLFDAVAEVRERGYGLLIGHPERCPGLMTRDGGLDELAAAGGKLLQVNGSSLTGRHGEQARRWALELALAGRVAVIASDAHRPSRGPVLSAAMAELTAAGVTPETAEATVSTTPRALLDAGIAPERGETPR
jgi:protein-tyrosine phosphatase